MVSHLDHTEVAGSAVEMMPSSIWTEAEVVGSVVETVPLSIWTVAEVVAERSAGETVQLSI